MPEPICKNCVTERELPSVKEPVWKPRLVSQKRHRSKNFPTTIPPRTATSPETRVAISTDKELPKRAKLRTEIALPTRANCITVTTLSIVKLPDGEVEQESRKKEPTDRLLSSCAKPRNGQVRTNSIKRHTIRGTEREQAERNRRLIEKRRPAAQTKRRRFAPKLRRPDEEKNS
jgi:hypothetical protein